MLETVISSVHDLLLGHLPLKTTKTPSGWMTLDCPICSDKRKRGGIITNGSKISYNCFNCGFKTGWAMSPYLGKKYKDLAEALGATQQQVHAVQVELLKHGDEFDTTDVDNFVYNIKQFKELDLPEDWELIENLVDTNELKQYAKDRDLLGLYPLMHFKDLANKKRLIVPFFYDDKLVGWTGRHIDPPNKQTPKYLHNMQSGYVFNIDKFINSDRKLVVVTEGVFDAILIDGISVMGNSVTAEQAHLIDKLDLRVIVCPDRDKAGIELIDQALELGWEVSFPNWASDIKDAADAVHRYGRLATLQSIIDNATDNKIKAQVKTKLINI